ncbi:MAG TPA: hypothetical protein V6D05_12200 [Stenomitos sp.]
MPFNLYDAIAAGLWATVAFTAFMTLALALGFVHVDFGRLLGGIFMTRLDRTAAAVGLVINYLIGVVFGIIYAAIFATVGLGPVLWLSTIVGAGFGLYHWLLSMPLLSIGRALNPHIRSGEEADPGVWGIHYGPQEAFFRLIGHVIYGGVFGFSYFAIALLNGTASGATVAGRGVAILLALILAAAVVYLYVAWAHPETAEQQGLVFQAGEPSEEDQRWRARQDLRMRYEHGEITWDEYQHLRRQYAAEP